MSAVGNDAAGNEVVEALRTTLKERDRLRRENALLQAAAAEPIAIVGMSCRYPGGVSSPRDLWRLVERGADGISGFPDDRGWDVDRIYHPDPDNAGTTYVREGGFLADAWGFDAEFFSTSPREALFMDVQERLLLESCWEALEDAGIPPASLKETQTGVFAGVGDRSYGPGAGGTASIVSGRVAYTFGLEGPAISIDTACSSSLVAMHLAAQALRQGEATLVLAGGVTVLSTPGPFLAFSAQRGLAPDGRCKSFAEAADGTGWSEGVGVLVLERLSDAQRNGHEVLAVIRGSAVNQDGASNGLTAPNGPSQERVIRQALANARLQPQDIDAVEGHGTGTTLGDPIEATALLATYGQEREQPLRLGSIKSNIGHTQAAAGVAGVIKMTEAMRHGVLPKTLHLDAPSSKVEWEQGQIELLAEPVQWQPEGRPRRAGVSSFGISGTNAHVILEEAPQPAQASAAEEPPEPKPLEGPVPLALSAKTEPALRESAKRLRSHIEANPELCPTDLAYSLITTRSSFEHRAIALGESKEELLTSLACLAAGTPSPSAIAARASEGRLAYLLTGQGSQRPGMGMGLYETDEPFRAALERACEQIDRHLELPLKELLLAKGKRAKAKLAETAYAQPALFATQVALHESLAARGLEPELLCGHSVGEIAAAHIAGVFDLKDAARLICARGALMGALPKGGAMAAIEATEQQVAEAIAGREAELGVAAVNGPASTVISGTEQAVEELRATFEAQGAKSKRLAVSHAFHSPLIEPILEQLAELASELSPSEPQLTVISNLTAQPLSPQQATDPAYWASHARQPVRFADSLQTLRSQGAGAYLELGPDPVLLALARESLGAEAQVELIATLREGREEPGTIERAIAHAHAAGAKVDWGAYFRGTGAKRVPLPTYPFQRKRYWLQSALVGTGDLSAAGLSDPGHPLLSATIDDPGNSGLSIVGRLQPRTQPWLGDNAVGGVAVLPNAAFLELALRAAEEVEAEAVEALAVETPIAIPENGALAAQVSVSGVDDDGGRALSIFVRPQGDDAADWIEAASGRISAQAPEPPEPLDSWPPAGAEPLDVGEAYDRLAEHGLELGPSLQALRAVWRDGERLYAEAALPDELQHEAERFCLHPALLEAASHGSLLLATGEPGEPGLPVAWEAVSLRAVGATRLRVCVTAREGSTAVQIYDPTGAPLAAVASLLLRPLDPAQLEGARRRDGLLDLRWEAAPLAEPNGDPAGAELLECEIDRDEGAPAATRRALAEALEALQAWIAEEPNPDSRLTLLTEGAMAAAEGERPDPAAAAVWGLVRSAQSEHPGRFCLIDTDGSEASRAALGAALALGAEEPQIALREGAAFVPRLARRESAAGQQPAELAIDPERTVLLTGATGGLGALLARHLAERHGARHLLLVSRSGAEAEGAAELLAELEELGAEARIAACDVADRAALERVLSQVPSERPLGAVVHCAGALADATLESLEPEQLELVLAPKADAAHHLHELTAQLDLSAFVLFSSAAGTLGGPGQANYAAANVFLDALAQRRRAEGLPATSIAWGPWERAAGMVGGLADADLARMRAGGIGTLSDRRGLELLDAAVESEGATAVAMPLELTGLRTAASVGALSPIFRGLVRVPKRRSAGAGSLATKLASLPEEERERHVLELVRATVAAVLGHASTEQIEPRKAFKELGLDSLGAVELRNRLDAIAGLRLAATVVFDHPSSIALAEHLLREATASGAAAQVAVRGRATDEPIAIVGMACRYPGGVDSPAALWRLVVEGRDGIGEFPADRGWDIERLYDPRPGNPGTSYTREGGFLAETSEFDADFFAISPREALFMDPQQRLLLESSWEALEDAGIDPASLRKTQTGVFAGVAYQDYGPIAMSSSIVSGRVSYTLGLEGPAITVDTACSSSLVAMHLAAQALRQGECTLALTGGVSTVATPDVFVEFSRQRALSPDGRCKAFAESADGTGWAEGVGVLVLERLSDARRHGREVLATIRGSAVNQDGASNGLTAPNGPAQERVIRQALANAGLAPGDVDAVEAHGTGTTLGDPIEAGALLAAYGQDREAPLRLGSLKSNVGHTQAAAGVGGVIKMTQAMRHGVLPKTLHVDAPSTKIEWEAGAVELLTEQIPWEPGERRRRAGVSSFGISGTNAHLILEEAPAARSAPARTSGSPAGRSEPARPVPVPLIFPLSAKSEPALRESASRLAAHIEQDSGLEPTDLAYSLATTRSCFEHRAVAVAEDTEQLLAALDATARGEPSERVALGHARAAGRPVFLYPGQGSQWRGMALDLVEAEAAFAAKLRECEDALSEHVDFSIVDALRGAAGAPSIERIEVVQPVLFAVMASLTELWLSRGVRPAAVAGHSQGEIVAAYAAGGLSLGDAAMLAARRSRIIAKLAGKGGMVSVARPAGELEDDLGQWEGRIEIAARNGPSSTILSGDRESLDQLLERCEAEGVRAREIPAAIASHSTYVEELRDEVLTELAGLVPRSGEIPFHSTVAGGPLDTAELDASYWYRNLREPVRFQDVTEGLLEAGHRVFVEVSPHPVFSLAVGETIEATLEAPGEAAAVGTLRRDEPGPERFALSLAQAHAAGAELEWERCFDDAAARAVRLPTYPFQRQRYWLESGAGGGDGSGVGLAATEHPLLGAGVELAGDGGHLLSGRISLSTHPWLAGHSVGGTVLLPATAFLELALRAAEQVGAEVVEELTLQAPLVLTEGRAVALQVLVSPPDGSGRRQVVIHARPDEDGEWVGHAAGTLSAGRIAPPEPPGSWPPAGARPLDVEYAYDRLAELGVEYGDAFQGLTAAWRGGEHVYAEIVLPESAAYGAERFAIHPALLDSALQAAQLAKLDDQAGPALGFPFAWRNVSVTAAGASGLRARLAVAEQEVSMDLFDAGGSPVATVGSLVFRPLDSAQLRNPGDLLRVEWAEVPLGERQSASTDGEVLHVEPAGGDPAEAARESVRDTLSAAREWLERDRAGGMLAVVTERGVAAAGDEPVDPAAAAAWGLIRSAQSEQPGRFCLLDSDGSEASRAALPAALARAAEEPQLALRDGTAFAPRLVRSGAAGEEPPPSPLRADRTVLIGGDAGGAGAIAARHLVERHGARHLLLLVGAGEADAAEGLRHELESLGAEARIAACELDDRDALRATLNAIPAERPLGAVVHCVTASAEGLIESLDGDRLGLALAPKARAAWNLHELTAEMDLTAFVLFSSLAGTFGLAGQAGHAAASSFLDALAQRRRAEGLPATSIAWGLWDRQASEEATPSEGDAARLRRLGIGRLATDEAMELLDRALVAGPAVDVALRLELGGLRSLAETGALPPLFSRLVRASRRRSAGTGALAARLASLSPEQASGLVLELVRSEVAAVLGHSSGGEVEPGRAFQELGFDSVTAVELRNRVNAATGLRLPATVVFDYPSAAALADHIVAEASGEESPRTAVRARASEEPIAVVGMACRYPGGASSPEALWQLVDEGRDAISEFPGDRGWDIEGVYNPDRESFGTSYAREGGFLADAGEFDAGFFAIGPREALFMDPQERLLLEASWEALEDAGIDPLSLKRTETGVFAGVAYQDYGPYPVMSSSVVTGRVSYALGLQGPAITVNTACSSSLVAMHLASQALRGGECELALAGGVTIISSPGVFIDFSRQGGLAPDGRSKPFADAADGAGFSDGVGVLILERLSDAERNGHEVLATIRGSAVNQDGASNGLTAPNGPSQERVIRQALANAGLEPKDVDAVEAHGTGTTLGDPIEAGALLATYGQDREEPLKLGSLKSNIGHTQAAAGVAGVIKMTEAMRRGVLPKTLHVDEPSSKVDWEAGEIELLSEARPWQTDGRPRRAGVSSFGVSGTNAHVILEQAPEPSTAPAAQAGERGAGAVGALPLPFPLSAKTEPALRESAARLKAHVEANPELEPQDLAHSLATTRSAFEHRAVAVAEERQQLLAALDAIASAEPSQRVARARAPQARRPVFLFPGQGAQAKRMAAGLIEASPAFRAQIEACEQALAPHVQWSLAEVLADPEGEWLGRLEVVQPALFAVMVSLARLWIACGVRPAALAGHSQGEIAAAHISGALTLEDAALIVARRAQAMAKLAGKGTMLSLALDPAALPRYAEPHAEQVSLAARNGPASLVLSGDPEALEQIRAACEADGHRAKLIAVDYAAHSPQIEALEQELLEAFAPISPQRAEIPLLSTVTAEPLEGPELGPSYWYRNLRETVLFEPAMAALLAQGHRAFVEIGPHPVLAFGAAETIEAALSEPEEATLLASLRRGEEDPERFALSLAEAHAHGVELDWEACLGSGAKRVKLPTYPFQRERYWLAPAVGGTADSGGNGHAAVDLQALQWQPPAERDVEALVARLAGLPAEARGLESLELVLAQTAEILGHGTPDAVDADRPFVELGVDSVGAMELRKRLVALVGVRIPISVLSNQPTLRELAAHVARNLDPSPGEERDDDASAGFVSLLAQAREQRKVKEFMALLTAASELRPSFDGLPPAGAAPSTVRLADGSAAPSVVLMPSLVAIAGPQEYVRFARGLEDRPVLATRLPGFAEAEPLPAGLDAVARTAAEAVLREQLDGGFVLAGYSSGGWVAHVAAAELERRGAELAAVVLLDAPSTSVDTSKLLELIQALDPGSEDRVHVPADDARLTAMARYFQLFAGWEPQELDAPVLLVRGSEPLDGVEEQVDRLHELLEPAEAVAVPGNHMTMMWEHAESTARAVQELIEPLTTQTLEREAR